MFDIQQTMAASTLEPFAFVGPSGEPCELPHIRKLPVRLGVQAMSGDVEAIEVVLETVGAKLSFDLLDLDAEVLEALMTAWKEHSGVLDEEEQGKSPSSSRSSQSTARSSRSTSGATSKSRTRKR